MNRNLSKKEIVASAYIIISALLLWSVYDVKMDAFELFSSAFFILLPIWFGLSIYICSFYINKLFLRNEFFERHEIVAKSLNITISILLAIALFAILFPF